MHALVDGDLADLLRAFRRHAGADDSQPSPVSVEVTRLARFTNLATTASSLTIALDEPVDFGGRGDAPDPAEYLLAAIGASLSVTLTAHAALRSLAMMRISVSLKGEIDGRSFFEPRVWTRTGLLETQVAIKMAGSFSKLEARALLAEAVKACPVLQSLRRRPRISLNFERTPA
jgi:uncharacterized OsmC-like protein